MIRTQFNCGHCWYWARDYGTNNGECKYGDRNQTTDADSTCGDWQPCGENAYKRRWAEKYINKII